MNGPPTRITGGVPSSVGASFTVRGESGDRRRRPLRQQRSGGRAQSNRRAAESAEHRIDRVGLPQVMCESPCLRRCDESEMTLRYLRALCGSAVGLCHPVRTVVTWSPWTGVWGTLNRNRIRYRNHASIRDSGSGGGPTIAAVGRVRRRCCDGIQNSKFKPQELGLPRSLLCYHSGDGSFFQF